MMPAQFNASVEYRTLSATKIRARVTVRGTHVALFAIAYAAATESGNSTTIEIEVKKDRIKNEDYKNVTAEYVTTKEFVLTDGDWEVEVESKCDKAVPKWCRLYLTTETGLSF